MPPSFVVSLDLHINNGERWQTSPFTVWLPHLSWPRPSSWPVRTAGAHSCADVALKRCCRLCWGLLWPSQVAGDGFRWCQRDVVVAWRCWALWWWLREEVRGLFETWDVSQMRDRQLPNGSVSTRKCQNIDCELTTQPIKAFYSPLESTFWVEHSYIKLPEEY